MKSETLKKMFIAIAYTAYIASTLIQNEASIPLGRYQYVFVFIVGVCLKLAQHVEVVEKIIYTMNPEDMEIIKERLNSIVEQSQHGSLTQRSTAYGDNGSASLAIEIPPVNEPITPSEREMETHRDMVLSNGNIIRIHNK